MNKTLFEDFENTFGGRIEHGRRGATLDNMNAEDYRFACTQLEKQEDIDFNMALADWLDILTAKREAKKASARKRRRAVRDAYESVGTVRVRGALGGVYYE